jgi:hypothetical protein
LIETRYSIPPAIGQKWRPVLIEIGGAAGSRANEVLSIRAGSAALDFYDPNRLGKFQTESLELAG